MRRKGRAGAGIGVGKAGARQPDCGCAYITCVRREIAELSLQTRRPRVKSRVAEGAVDAAEIQIADYVARSKRGHVLLIAIHIHRRVGSNVFRVSRGQNIHTGGGVGVRQLRRRNLKSILNRCIGGRKQPRIDGKGRGAGKKVVLPNIGLNHHDASTSMSRNLLADLPRGLNARLPGIPVRLVAGLRVNHKLLLAADG